MRIFQFINRLANSSFFCFCVWLAFALWVWSVLDDKGHKQLLIGGVVSIVCGVLQLLGRAITGQSAPGRNARRGTERVT